MKYKVEVTEEPRYEVMIEDLPQAKTGMQVNYSLFNKLAAVGGGADMNMSEPNRTATKTITRVPREAANLEAEGGETVLTFDPTGFPLFYTIKGPRHHSGGVPLNLPDDSFIFSDTKEMIIRDCTILKMFNKACNKKGFTPAALSKQFDINRYRNILQDPNTDQITRNTAESMVKKYVVKLGALSLAQESMKGFPQGIPVVAKPYMDANGISENDILPEEAPAPEMAMQQGQGQMSPTDQMPPDQYAGEQMPDGMQNASPDQLDEAQMQQIMMAQQQQQGAPQGMATPEMVEPMMQQMEQQGPPPTAMYGMSMGGFYPEFAFGGFPMYPDGGAARPADTKKVGPDEYGKSTWETRSDEQGEYKYSKEKGNVEGRVEYDRQSAPGGGGPFKGNLCTDMKTKGRKAYGKTAEEVIAYAFPHLLNEDGTPKTTGWQAKTYQDQLATLKGCEVAGAREVEKAIYTEDSPEEKCPDCIDPTTGQAVTTGPDGKPFTRTKDANGNCTPCPTSECYCEDEMGNQVVVDCNDPCTKEEGSSYSGESGYNEIPVENLPEDEFGLWANLAYRNAEARPEYIGPRGVQLEQYGIDPRAKANAAGAVANKIIETQGKFVQNPGGGLANMLMAQAAAAPQIDAAFDEAAKFNTGMRNQEIQTNTAYRKDYLDKLPLFAQDYLGKVAKYKENDARFWNEKLGRFVQDYKQMKGNARDMALINASNENMKFDPRSNKVYSVKTKDFTPNQTTDLLAKTKQVMAEGIDDENVAYKIAQTMVRKGGPVYNNGGFVYANAVFPFIL